LREKKLSLLPTVTSRSPPCTAKAGGGAANTEQTNTPSAAIDRGIRLGTTLIRALPLRGVGDGVVYASAMPLSITALAMTVVGSHFLTTLAKNHVRASTFADLAV
jgi:hypothetical protein